jgi:hypothetical protein
MENPTKQKLKTRKENKKTDQKGGLHDHRQRRAEKMNQRKMVNAQRKKQTKRQREISHGAWKSLEASVLAAPPLCNNNVLSRLFFCLELVWG